MNCDIISCIFIIDSNEHRNNIENRNKSIHHDRYYNTLNESLYYVRVVLCYFGRYILKKIMFYF